MELKQYILLLINEESNELAKESDKAIRFGLSEHHPEDPQQISNNIRINNKFIDLVATLLVANIIGIQLDSINYLTTLLNTEYKEQINIKINKIIKFMKMSVCEHQLNMTLLEVSQLHTKINEYLQLLNPTKANSLK